MRCFRLLAILWVMIISATPSWANDVEEVVSDYGFKAWMMQDHALPIVSLHMAFQHSGTAYDPEGKEGLANLVVALLGEGTEAQSATEFKKALESRAIHLSFDVDQDTIYVTVKTLTEHVETAFAIVQQVLLTPRFDQKNIDLAKQQILTTIAARKESPEYIARKAFRETLFAGHPYAKPDVGTETSIAAITKEDLHQFVTAHFTRPVMLISAVGDIRGDRLSSLMDTYFVELPLKKNHAGTLSVYKNTARPMHTVINLDVPQSVAILGHIGITRDDPDFYPIYMLNHMLGNGGFESRLMKAVREKNGLAYSVYTYLDTMNQAGIFQGMVGSQNTKIEESLVIIKKEMTRLQKEGVTAEELQNAKSYLTGSFPLRLDKNEKIAQFLLGMQLENLGIAFLEKRNGYINALTLEDINRVAKTFLQPDKLTVVVVGNEKEITAAGKGKEQ